MINIIELINSNKWDQIFDLIKNNKLDHLNKINQGNTIAHIAVNHGKQGNKILVYLSKHDPSSLRKLDSDGQTCLHLLVKNANYDLLFKCLGNYPDLINAQNNKSKSVVFYLIKNSNSDSTINKIIKKIVHEFNNIDYYAVDNNLQTIIHAIINSHSKNPFMLELLSYIVTHNNIDLNYPLKNPPLIYAINKEDINIIQFLLSHNTINLATEDANYVTALSQSVRKNNVDITKLLLQYGANPNQQGSYALHDPMFIAINNGNENIISLLLEYGYDCRLCDKYLNTAAHQVLIKDPTLNYHIIFQVLVNKNSNINKKNINNDTPLDILQKKFDTKVFKALLDHKNQKQKQNKTLKINEKVSKINFPSYKQTEPKSFLTSPLYNIIYTLTIFLKYANLVIPFQFDQSNKKNNDLRILSFYYNKNNTVFDIVSNYTNMFYCFLPHIILWKSPDEYYIHPDFDFYIKKCMNVNSKTRFIMCKISLVVTNSSTHANILLIDKNTGIVDRFDPYGSITLLNTESLDDILEKKLTRILKPIINIKYLRNKIDRNLVSFQTISNDDNVQVKKAYDPFGYCLAWCFWYLELRLINPDIHPHKLIKFSIDKIITNFNTSKTNYISSEEVTETNIENTKKFNDYIRSYASHLDSEKNKLLRSFNISENNFYDVIFSTANQNIIVNSLNNLFIDNTGRYLK